MRHRHSGRQLNRNASHRKAMFKNMAVSLLRHEQIKTTVPKAKELRKVVEPLITLAGSASVANRRLAFARLRDRGALRKLHLRPTQRVDDLLGRMSLPRHAQILLDPDPRLSLGLDRVLGERSLASADRRSSLSTRTASIWRGYW